MGISLNKKELLCIFVDFKCEECKNHFEIQELDAHRLKRGSSGGTYEDFRNLKIVCKECHKLYHYGEFKR